MSEWSIFNKSNEHWDELLSSYEQSTIFQTSLWREYKLSLGQEAIAFIKDDGSKKLMFQGILKRTPFGGGVLWVPGGFVGDFELLNKNPVCILKKELALNFLLIRVSFLYEEKNDFQKYLLNSGAERPWKTMGSGKSLQYSPLLQDEQLKKNMGSNWRHNLKRFDKYPVRISIWDNPDFEKIHELYQKLEAFKKISQQYSLKEMTQMKTTLLQSMILLKAEDANGKLLGLRACLFCKNKAWDFLAAVTEDGRKQYVSYGLFWELIKNCKLKGIDSYDLMGIDLKKNPGVFHFKKGTGARDLNYLGEWEWSNSILIRILFNILLIVKK